MCFPWACLDDELQHRKAVLSNPGELIRSVDETFHKRKKPMKV